MLIVGKSHFFLHRFHNPTGEKGPVGFHLVRGFELTHMIIRAR